MIEITECDDGILIPLRVTPSAKRSSVGGVRQGALCVAVTTAAEKGKANKAVVEQLAKFFDLRRSQLEIVSGLTSRHKRVLISGISSKRLVEKVAGEGAS